MVEGCLLLAHQRLEAFYVAPIREFTFRVLGKSFRPPADRDFADFALDRIGAWDSSLNHVWESSASALLGHRSPSVPKCLSAAETLLVRNGHDSTRFTVAQLYFSLQVSCQRFHNSGAQAGLWRITSYRKPNASVGHRKGPVGRGRSIVDQDRATSLVRERVLERVDDKFSDNEP